MKALLSTQDLKDDESVSQSKADDKPTPADTSVSTSQARPPDIAELMEIPRGRVRGSAARTAKARIQTPRSEKPEMKENKFTESAKKPTSYNRNRKV